MENTVSLIKQAISRILFYTESVAPIIYLGLWSPKGSNRLPFGSGVQPSSTDLHDVSPHRVYLISLQHYLYILSVALVRPDGYRETGVTRYAALWCPDFPR